MGDKWTLLIVRDLVTGPRRFVELQRVLPGISTEQLRSRLNRMVADGLLTRQRYREVPPRVDYELTERARELVPVVAALARWGHAWAWGEPRPGEAVDIGAIFRATLGVLGDTAPTAGTVELVVEGQAYSLTVGAGPALLAEHAPALSDARIAGSEAGWIAALGPSAERDALQRTGDEALADLVLDALSPAGASATIQAA